MRKIYLIVNNMVLNNIDYLNDESIDERRVKRPLSIEGESFAKNLSNLKELQNVTSIYSSGFSSALCTAKYLSNQLNVVINIENKLNERKVGQTNKQTNKQTITHLSQRTINDTTPPTASINN